MYGSKATELSIAGAEVTKAEIYYAIASGKTAKEIIEEGETYEPTGKVAEINSALGLNFI